MQQALEIPAGRPAALDGIPISKLFGPRNENTRNYDTGLNERVLSSVIDAFKCHLRFFFFFVRSQHCSISS